MDLWQVLPDTNPDAPSDYDEFEVEGRLRVDDKLCPSCWADQPANGAAYAAIPWHPVVVTTVLYTVATLVTGNVMLTFAAAVLGLVVGLERRASGGILAPILTHITWSVTMAFTLPALLG